MAGVDKLVDKMRRQPTNMTFTEVKKVLEAYGYEEKRVRGSHHVFKHEQTGDRWPLPNRKPLKPYYVRETLKRIGED